MQLPTQVKEQAIQEFKERLQQSKVAIATRFIGINAEQSTVLRKKLRDQNAQIKVYKNNLVKRALDELGLSGATKYLDGPTAWAFSMDPVSPAKVLKEYNKEVDKVAMAGGVLEGVVVSKEQLDALASLPSREALLGQLVGVISMPLRNFVSVINAPTRDFVNVLDQIRKKKEENQAA